MRTDGLSSRAMQIFTVSLFLAGALLKAQPVYTNFTIVLGPTNIVPDTTPAIPTYPYAPDGHISFLADNATNSVCQMYWAGSSSYRSLGTNVPVQSLNPGTALIGPGSSTDFDNGGAWLMSVCRIDTNELVGFYHAEDWNWPGYSNPGNIAWKSMAFCTSTNNGKTWSKAGQFLTSSTPKPSTPTWGGAGDGCVVYDKANARWVCFYSGTWMIYAAVSTNAIPLPGTWQKYCNGSFSTPGLGGQETPIPALSSFAGANPSVHFNTCLDRWVMVFETSDDTNGSGLYLSTSADLLNWTPPVTLVAATFPQQAWYATIIGRSDVEASREATLYYAYWPDVNTGPRQAVSRTIQFNLPDTMGDGVPDAWKMYYFGSTNDPQAAASADPDGDGQNNLSEYYAGTDPTNAASLIQFQGIQTGDAGQIVLNWQSVSNKYYAVETSTDLVNWTPVVQNIPAAPPANQYTNSVPTGQDTSFYRVSVAPY
jgi:hypothetical protein